MSRFTRRRRLGLAGVVVLAAGCAGPYDDPTTSSYILGAIFILIGVILAYELMRNS